MSRAPTYDEQYDLLTDEERAAHMAESVETPARREKRVKRRNLSRVGKTQERAVVKLLQAIPGIRARRVPGSGSIEGTEDCDILIGLLDTDWAGVRTLTTEVKARKVSGWKTLVKWRSGADILVLVEMQNLPGQKKPTPEILLGWDLFSWLLERAARP